MTSKIDYDNKVGMIHTAKDGLLSAALNIAEPGQDPDLST